MRVSLLNLSHAQMLGKNYFDKSNSRQIQNQTVPKSFVKPSLLHFQGMSNINFGNLQVRENINNETDLAKMSAEEIKEQDLSVQYLRKALAVQNRRHETFLHLADIPKTKAVIEKLGKDAPEVLEEVLFITDKFGNTPLSGNEEKIRILTKALGDKSPEVVEKIMRLKMVDGNTILRYATSEEAQALIEALGDNPHDKLKEILFMQNDNGENIIFSAGYHTFKVYSKYLTADEMLEAAMVKNKDGKDSFTNESRTRNFLDFFSQDKNFVLSPKAAQAIFKAISCNDIHLMKDMLDKNSLVAVAKELNLEYESDDKNIRSRASRKLFPVMELLDNNRHYDEIVKLTHNIIKDADEYNSDEVLEKLKYIAKRFEDRADEVFAEALLMPDKNEELCIMPKYSVFKDIEEGKGINRTYISNAKVILSLCKITPSAWSKAMMCPVHTDKQGRTYFRLWDDEIIRLCGC